MVVGCRQVALSRTFGWTPGWRGLRGYAARAIGIHRCLEVPQDLGGLV